MSRIGQNPVTVPSGVTVDVVGIDILTSDLTLETCDGTDATYEGTSLPVKAVMSIFSAP